MTMRRTLILGALVIGITTIMGGNAEAVFVEIDNFNGLTLGPVDDQNGWYASDSSSQITADPADAGNQVLSILTSSTFLFHAADIPEGQARMLFMRFRYEDQLSASFGMSESSFPDQFGNFEPELSLTSTNDDLRINDGGTYSELTSLDQELWYNCWLYIDNGADVTAVWIHSRPNEPATAEDQLDIDDRTLFPFRQGTLNPMQNIFIKTGGGDGVAGPLLLDDIYLQDTAGLDLSCPANPVAGVTPVAHLHLKGAWPNPFNPQTIVNFTLDETQAIELAVYDLGGRLVRLLGDGVWESGTHEVAWDGRDQAGGAMASGIYLVRLSSRLENQSVKLVLAR